MRALVAIGLALPAVASAAPTPESTQANAEGQQLFRAGRYLESVPSFEHAYAIDPDPAYLFDIAQAYRLGHSCAKAVDYYDRFFAAVPNPPSADKIHAFRDAAATCAKEQAPTPAPVSVPLEPAPVPIVEPPPSPPARSSSSLHNIGIATIAVGAVAAGIGVYFSVHASSLASDRAGLCPDNCTWDQTKDTAARDLDDRGHSAQRWSAISYAVGGAAIAAGVTMYILGRDARTTPTIAIAPQPSGAFAIASLTF